MRKYLATFTLLALICFTTINGQSGPYSSLENNVLTLDNGLLKRVIVLDNGEGQIATTRLSLTSDDFNFINTGNITREFSLQVYNMPLSGVNRWELKDVEEVSDDQGGHGARVSFRGYGVMSVLELQITYLMYPGLPVIRKNLTMINRGEKDFMVEGVDVEALTLRSTPTTAELYINYARNKHSGPYEGDWDDPLIAMHLPEQGKGVILGNEAPGVLKRIAFYKNNKDFCAGLTHPDQPYPFRKWLTQGESFTTPDIFLVLYRDAASPYEALNFVVPRYVREYMGLEIFKKDYKPVFVYNTWTPFRKNIDHEMIGELSEAAEECGIREFVLDDGWEINKYTEKNPDAPHWHAQVGDYYIDKDKFPDGLKPVFDDIKSRGMKPGLWLSIGSATNTAEVFRSHQEWFVAGENGKPANLHNTNNPDMLTACMSTGWVGHIRDIILNLEKEYGLAYTKLDFAVVTSAYVIDPVISGCYSTEHAGHKDHKESFIANYNGLFSLFDQLQKAAPDLFIDCTFETQGKLHLIDYAFMKHAEGNWLSNIEDISPIGALRVRHLAWLRTPILPAASCVIGNLRLDSRDLEFDFYSLMGTFPIMLGDIREVTDEKRRWLKQQSEWMEEMQEQHDYLSYRQDLRGFGEPGEGNWDGWQRINTETRSGGVVGVFRQGSRERQRTVTVEGLAETTRYKVVNVSDHENVGTFTGLQLKNEGFPVKMEKDYQGKIFEISHTLLAEF